VNRPSRCQLFSPAAFRSPPTLLVERRAMDSYVDYSPSAELSTWVGYPSAMQHHQANYFEYADFGMFMQCPPPPPCWVPAVHAWEMSPPPPPSQDPFSTESLKDALHGDQPCSTLDSFCTASTYSPGASRYASELSPFVTTPTPHSPSNAAVEKVHIGEGAALWRLPPNAATTHCAWPSVVVVTDRGMLSAFELGSLADEFSVERDGWPAAKPRAGSVRRASCPPMLRGRDTDSRVGAPAEVAADVTIPVAVLPDPAALFAFSLDGSADWCGEAADAAGDRADPEQRDPVGRAEGDAAMSAPAASSIQRARAGSVAAVAAALPRGYKLVWRKKEMAAVGDAARPSDGWPARVPRGGGGGAGACPAGRPLRRLGRSGPRTPTGFAFAAN